MKIDLTEDEDTIRDHLAAVLKWEHLKCLWINLRDGRTITLADPQKNPQGLPYEIRLGKNYIELDDAPGGDISVYEIIPLSQIASVGYF